MLVKLNYIIYCLGSIVVRKAKGQKLKPFTKSKFILGKTARQLMLQRRTMNIGICNAEKAKRKN